jgi:hypothetical protein
MGYRMRFTQQHGSEVGYNEEEHAFIVPVWPPNDVRLPPELGGSVVEVVQHDDYVCPYCEVLHRGLLLENGTCVLDCPPRGFLWFTKEGGASKNTSDILPT